MTTLESLVGLQFFLVRKWLTKMRALPKVEARRALLQRIEKEDGADIAELVKAAYIEQREVTA